MASSAPEYGPSPGHVPKMSVAKRLSDRLTSCAPGSASRAKSCSTARRDGAAVGEDSAWAETVAAAVVAGLAGASVKKSQNDCETAAHAVEVMCSPRRTSAPAQ